MKKILHIMALCSILSVPCMGLDYKSFTDSKGNISPVLLDNAVRDTVEKVNDVDKKKVPYSVFSASMNKTVPYTVFTSSMQNMEYRNVTFSVFGTSMPYLLTTTSATATYATKNFMSSYAAKSNNAKYEATTDGAVTVYLTALSDGDLASVVLLIGSSVDIDAGNYATCAAEARFQTAVTTLIMYNGFSCPVNKGQYWKVIVVTAGSGACTARWISFGN